MTILGILFIGASVVPLLYTGLFVGSVVHGLMTHGPTGSADDYVSAFVSTLMGVTLLLCGLAAILGW